jgi:hypothetical protein
LTLAYVFNFNDFFLGNCIPKEKINKPMDSFSAYTKKALIATLGKINPTKGTIIDGRNPADIHEENIV